MIPCRLSAYIPPPPLPTGAILYLPFDGAIGTSVFPDESGSAQTQTILGTGTDPVIAVGGVINECCDFTGTSKYLSSTARITSDTFHVSMYVVIPANYSETFTKYIFSQGSLQVSIEGVGANANIAISIGGDVIFVSRDVTSGANIHVEINKEAASTSAITAFDGVVGGIVGVGAGYIPANEDIAIGARLDGVLISKVKVDNLLVLNGEIIAEHLVNFIPPTQNYEF